MTVARGAAATSGHPAASRGKIWLSLLAMAMGVMVIACDFTAVYVAVPTIEHDFGTTVNTIQWVVNAYALTFGVLIVTGGRLADMFGRRRIFFVGAGIFAFTSALAGVAPSVAWLIAARTLMGVGGALMWPAILGMTFVLLPPERAGIAGGLILGATGVGNALGPLFGGVLTDLASWRWIFFLSVAIAAFSILVTYLLVEIREPQEGDRKVDYPGVATLSLGLVSLLIALDFVADWGWGDPRVIAMLALTVGLIGVFIPLERRAGAQALVPPEVISNRRFAASCLAIPFMAANFFGAMFYLPQVMQEELGYSPLAAGIGTLPLLATFTIVSFAAGPLYQRVGAKRLAVVGGACLATAPLLLSLEISEGSGFGALVPGMVLIGIGSGLFTPTATTAGLTALASSRASLAGGIVFMFQVAGGSLGLGLTTAFYSAASPPFIEGIRAAFRVDGLLSLVGLVIAALFVGGRLGRRRSAAALR